MSQNKALSLALEALDNLENQIELMTNSREKVMVKIENCKQKPAKGTKGMLLYTMNNEYVFRVYKEDHSFIDYDILHCDLDVTIDSDDATFYDFEDGRSILDHSFVMEGEDLHTDKGYEVGTDEGLNEFVKLRNKQ